MKKFKLVMIMAAGCILGYMLHYFVFCEMITRFVPYDSVVYLPLLILSVLFCIFGVTAVLFILCYRRITKRLYLSLLVIYGLLLILMLFGRSATERLFILNPLTSLREITDEEMLMQSILNLCCFIPLGWFFRKVERKKMIVLSIVLAFSLELLQTVTGRGMFDTFDALLYIAGMGIGHIVLKKVDIRIVEKFD